MTDHLPANFARRVRGAMVAAAVGDALGWPQEQRSSIVGGQKARNITPAPHFRRWQRNSGARFARYVEDIEPGEYSDDTQLLLATARSCLAGDAWLSRFIHIELPAWTLYQRGGGRAVLAAARAWAEDRPPWVSSGKASATKRGARDPVSTYFDAGSNGVVMRIAPHAVITAADTDPSRLLMRVVADGLTTHGHPRALVGAVVHALAIRYALLHRGTLGYGDILDILLEDRSWQHESWPESAIPAAWHKSFVNATGRPFGRSWKVTVEETLELLDLARRSLRRASIANDEETLEALGCFDKRRNGAGTVTAVAASYLAARTAAQPMTGLLRAAFLDKADTDTLASATASLLGAIHETDWLGPLAQQVQDIDLLVAISEQLAHAASLFATPETQLLPSTTMQDAPRSATLMTKTLNRFREDVFVADNGSGALFVDGRRYKILARRIHSMGRAGSTTELRLALEDGQSLVLHRHTKSSEDPPAEPTENNSTARPQARTNPAESLAAAKALHITVRVSHLARAVRFYRDIIGLDVQRVSEESARAASWLTLLERRHFNGIEATPPRNVLLTISVPSVSDIVKRAEAANIKIIHVDEAPGREHARLLDPDGHDLQITQDKAPEEE